MARRTQRPDAERLAKHRANHSRRADTTRSLRRTTPCTRARPPRATGMPREWRAYCLLARRMSSLDNLILAPRLLETDHVDIAAPAQQVWELVRNADLAFTPLICGLFNLRSLPERPLGHAVGPPTMYLNNLVSGAEQPGFQTLASDPPHELSVGSDRQGLAALSRAPPSWLPELAWQLGRLHVLPRGLSIHAAVGRPQDRSRRASAFPSSAS
jgi:hypothetical protein